MPKRGEIWRVSLDPTRGSETRKERPCVIVSSDRMGVLPVKLIVPLTDWNASYSNKPWIVLVLPSVENGLSKPSAAETLQTKAAALERFSRKIGILEDFVLLEIIQAVCLVLEAPGVTG